VAQKATFFNFRGASALNQLLTDIEKLVGPVLESERFELVDLTYQKQPGGWTLCFYLDKPGGVTLDDCQSWSDRLGSLLDQSDLIAHGYNLEVSSPGLERPLRKLEHFQKFIGERVHVKLFGPLEGQRNFHGTLAGADEKVVRVTLEDGREVALPREQIAKAKLNPVIKI
jgi:ribosome maturation factor RimP